MGNTTYSDIAAPTGGAIIQGNVGIGTTSPTNKLEVAGNTFLGGTLTATGTVAINSAARTSGSTALLSLVAGADTALTASTEAPDVQLNLARTKTHANGNITTQRSLLINAPTEAMTSMASGLFTDLATVGITGAPLLGNFSTSTNSHTLLLSASALNASTTNSYGLTVNANTGATNNYAAEFLGGNVGIGTTSPGSILGVNGVGNFVNGATSTLYNGLITQGGFTLSGAGTGVAQLNSGALSASSTIGVGYGGTNASSQTLNGVAYFDGSRLTTGSSNLTFDGTKFTATFASSTALTASGTGYFGTASTTNLTISSSPSGVIVTSATGAASASSTLGVNLGGTGATSFTAGSVIFSNGSTLAQNNSNFFWDNTNTRLGIGTTTPSRALTLSAGSSPQLSLTDTTPGSNEWTLRSISNSFYLATSTYSSTSTTAAIAINPNGQVSFMDGNVGIGTANPGLTLDVQAALADQRIKSTTGTNIAYLDFNNTGGDFYVGNENSAGGGLMGGSDSAYAGVINVVSAHSLQFGTNNAVRMTIDSSGNVGIGTTSPAYKLTVDNAANAGIVAGFENSAGECTINPTSSSVNCSSDITLKTNINDLSDAMGLGAIGQLNPVTFNWISEVATSSPHTGFIAQDVQKVLPDLVSQGSNGKLLLNYAGLTPYLVKAVQQLNVKVDNRTGGLVAAASSDIAPLSATTSAMELTTASSSVATTTPWVASFADASAALKQGIQSLADTVIHVLTRAFYSTVAIVEKLYAKEVHADKLCVSDSSGETCVTKAQLDRLLAGQAVSASSASQTAAAAASGASGGATTTSSTSASTASTTNTDSTSSPQATGIPIISINGNNPASPTVGDTYSDLGATITGPTAADKALGVHTFVDGKAMNVVLINTSAAGTHTIDYVAANSSGTATSTRTVIVSAPQTTTPLQAH